MKILIPVLVSLLALSGAAQAQSTWTGGGADGNWSTTGNWNTNVPASNSIVLFAGSTGLTTTNDTSVPALNSLTFSNTAGAFTLSGNGFRLPSGGSRLVNNSTANQTIALAITGALGTQTFIAVNAPSSSATAGILVFTNGGSLTTTTNTTGGNLEARFGVNDNIHIRVAGGSLDFAPAASSRLGYRNNSTNTNGTTTEGRLTVDSGSVLYRGGVALGGTVTNSPTNGGSENTFGFLTVNGGTVDFSGAATDGTGGVVYGFTTARDAGWTNGGDVTINGGVLRAPRFQVTNAGRANLYLSGGTLAPFGSNNLTVDSTVNFVLTGSGGTISSDDKTNVARTVTINTAIGQSGGSRSLTFAGAGTTTLAGTNTYTGDSTVNAGTTLTVATNGSLRFVIGGNGTNNALTGSGVTVMDGQFAFDLAGASTNTNATWTIVAGTLTNSYGTNFLVTGFSGAGGLWTNTTNGVSYVFAQSNSVLSVQSAATNNYDAWVADWQSTDPGFTNTAGTDDPEGDGFINNVEFAFDGNPTVGTPAFLTAVKSGTNAVFNYVARKNPPGGVTYAVRFTTNLAGGPWTNASVTISNSADQSGINLTNDYERKEFVVPATSSEFYKVEAAIGL